MVEDVWRRADSEGVRKVPSRSLGVPAEASREARRHHRGLRRRSTSTNETKQDDHQALEDLRSSFPIKDLEEISYYLGCHITQDRKARTLMFDQHRYAQTVTERFEIRKTSMIPVSTGRAPLLKADGP